MSSDEKITEVPMGIDRLTLEKFSSAAETVQPKQPFVFGRFDPKWSDQWHIFLDDRGRAMRDVKAGLFFKPSLCGAFYRNGLEKRHPRVVEAIEQLGTWNIAHGEACDECLRVFEVIKAKVEAANKERDQQ